VLHGIPNPFGCALSPPDIKDPLCFYYSNYARRMLALCIGVKLNCTLELREPADNRAVVRTVPYHLLRPGLKVFRTVPYILWGLGSFRVAGVLDSPSKACLANPTTRDTRGGAKQSYPSPALP
jgi:hypothetical protein